MKNNKKGNLSEENRWIDVHNDDVMREMGLYRPFEQAPRDASVWTKTAAEKRMLKKVGRMNMHFHSIPRKTINVYSKLIIYLNKNEHFSKTTYSVKCKQHEIPNILANYKGALKEYFWNGKTYGPKDLPFWK